MMSSQCKVYGLSVSDTTLCYNQPVSQDIGGSDGPWPVLVSHGPVFLRATGSHYGDEGPEQSLAVLS